MAEGHFVEVVFELRREVVVHVLREMLGQKAVDDAADVGRDESFAIHLDILAVLQRCDDARIRRWTADAVLLECLDEACFREARRWLREVLFRPQFVELDRVALGDLGQQAIAVVILGIVLALLVDGHEAGLDEYRAVRAQAVPGIFGTCRHLDGHGVEHSRHHLAGHRALPDQRVQLVLVVVERAPDLIRDMPDGCRTDGFVGLLCVLRLVLECAHVVRNVFLAVAIRDDIPNLGDGGLGERDRVGAHVGDKADLAFAGQLDAFVQLLRDTHRALCIKTELARCFLLQR